MHIVLIHGESMYAYVPGAGNPSQKNVRIAPCQPPDVPAVGLPTHRTPQYYDDSQFVVRSRHVRHPRVYMSPYDMYPFCDR